MHSSLEDLAGCFRIAKGRKFSLSDVDPRDTGKFKSPEKARELLKRNVQSMS